MQLESTHHRLPRAGIDPITDAATALALVSMVIHRPLRHETIAILLDNERRGVAITVVSGTEHPDSVVEVFECLSQAATGSDRAGAIMLASVRPDGDVDDHDVDRWLEMSDIAGRAGIELVEWFVVGRDVSCPRDLLGEPPRW